MTRQALDALLEKPTVLVTVASAKGSTPRVTDAWMAVSETDVFGTIGGGQLEYMAIDAARALLKSGERETRLDVPLGPEIGQCCGGRMALDLHVLDQDAQDKLKARLSAEKDARPDVLIFGAGHVGRALARTLMLLPVQPLLIDNREDELALALDLPQQLLAMPEASVRKARPGSAIVVATHDHALDFLIVREALERGDLPYVGMIGSKTKRRSFERWLEKEAGSRSLADKLICPIGHHEVSDKRPEVIAAFTAAELMDRLATAALKSKAAPA